MEDLRIPTIERTGTVTISVNGKKIMAYRGETVLAALQAFGFKALNKSKEMGEPRGALCGMGVCYGCLVSVNGVQNEQSCMIEVEDNMEISIDED
jgi:predicted molibdopterin-dependent oxidoreductase YjgC